MRDIAEFIIGFIVVALVLFFGAYLFIDLIFPLVGWLFKLIF